MTIREATLADLPAIQAMTSRFLEASIYGGFFHFNPAAIAQLLATVLEIGVVLVAETEEHRIAGMLAIAVVPHPMSGERFAEEIAWWVEPEYRNGTIAGRLIRKMLDWCRSQQLGMAKIGAPADKPDVGAFYERLGFVPVETAYVMRLE